MIMQSLTNIENKNDILYILYYLRYGTLVIVVVRNSVVRLDVVEDDEEQDRVVGQGAHYQGTHSLAV